MDIMKSVFIFHRDLSIEDNLGLYECIQQSEKVYLIFIFTPQQASNANKYFSEKSFSFLLNSIKELSKQVHISLFYSENKKCLEKLLIMLEVDAVWENADFSPFAKQRQKDNELICKKANIKYNLCHSITLLPMGTFNKNKKSYVKFTPFYNYAKTKKVPLPIQQPSNFHKKISKAKLPGEISLTKFKTVHKKGGRSEAILLLKDFKDNVKLYQKTRDILYKNSTSHLGPHLHFGTISSREVYHFFSDESGGLKEFKKQLYWREFYMYISNYITLDYTKKSWTISKYNSIKWITDTTALNKWKTGKTGIPIVDAGMREMLNTGYMQNRARMICAMYLIHYLGIHWKEGEKWFAQNLIDYSYANNYGGWVWCAGIEVYSNPYFRVYSMEQQNKRFDNDCEYIKKWCPEFKGLTSKEIFDIYQKKDLDKIRLSKIIRFKNS